MTPEPPAPAFRGFVYAPSDGAASVTLVNVMSQREREAILELDASRTRCSRKSSEDLYALTRNPNRLDLTGDGLPDESLLVGLTTQIVTNRNGTVFTNVVGENLNGPKALTASQPLFDVELPSKAALRFAGSGQGMKVDAGLTNLLNTFTVEFWVRPEVSRPSTPETNTGKDAQFSQPLALYPDQGSAVSGLSTRVGAGVSVGTNGIAVIEHGDNQDLLLPRLHGQSHGRTTSRWSTRTPPPRSTWAW